MPQVVDFPDCCGLIIINHFVHGHSGSDVPSTTNKKDTDNFLAEKEKMYYGQRAGLVAVLNETQNKVLGEVFLRRKWVLKLDGVGNGRTGGKLYMYFRDLNPTAARHRRIFGL